MIDKPIEKTSYTLEKSPDNDWTKVMKDGVQEAVCADEHSSLHAVWVLEDKPHDLFYVVDEDGVVNSVNRGVL